MSGNFTHFMRIGIHNEAEYFQKSRPLYDALIINANLVEATSAACAALIFRLGKPFLIDPFTHAFSLSPKYLMSKGKGKSQAVKVKRSFGGLSVKYFSDPSFIGQKALAPGDVMSIDAFTKSVLEYQESALTEVGAELVTLGGADPAIFKPTWLIAPYFPIRKSLAWLPTNLECLKSAVAQKPGSCAVIAVELAALRDKWTDIADAYAEAKPSSVFLWIESFDEDRAEERDLNLYCNFVKRLSEHGINVVNLFGGFFSCLAQCVGLGGFAHGLVYGENKSFTPVVGGGQPPPRFYMKPAHVSMNVREAELVLSGLPVDGYLDQVCDCTICSGLFKGKPDLTKFAEFAETNDQGKFMPRAYMLCRYHFLLARQAEITQITALAPADRIKAVEKNAAFLESIEAEEYAQHLHTWVSVIERFC